jgi:hypothetical protein
MPRRKQPAIPDELLDQRIHPAKAAGGELRGPGDAHRFWSRLNSLRLSMPRSVDPRVTRSSVS